MTFADSTLSKSSARLAEQARAFGVFEQVFAASEHNLSHKFRRDYATYLRAGVRGFGYWCWKPEIILATLSGLKYGDTLTYLDAGCHLNIRGIERFRQYIARCEQSAAGLVGFQVKPPVPPIGPTDRIFPSWLDSQYTKGDLIDYFGVRERADILETPTVAAGVIIIKKTKRSVKLLEDWRAVISESMHYFDDTPSVAPNCDGFIEHRHDQPAFSILCKLHEVEFASFFEMWYPSHRRNGADWSVLEDYPIHIRRDKRRRGAAWLRHAANVILSASAKRW